MPADWKPHHSRAWRKVRAQVLERDGHVCQIRGPKCVTVATHVDHIVAIADGGAWYDPGNLRASCEPCNTSRRVMKQARRPAPSRQW